MDIDPSLEAGPSEPAAGPSNAQINTSVDDTQSSGIPDPALERALPSTHYYSVEYPGFVQAASAPLAIERLGGQQVIESAFRRATGRDRAESLLELRLQSR